MHLCIHHIDMIASVLCVIYRLQKKNLLLSGVFMFFFSLLLLPLHRHVLWFRWIIDLIETPWSCVWYLTYVVLHCHNNVLCMPYHAIPCCVRNSGRMCTGKTANLLPTERMNEPIEIGNVSSGLVYYLKGYTIFITLIDCELKNGMAIPFRSNPYNQNTKCTLLLLLLLNG